MKKIIFISLAALSLASCNLITINDQALRKMLKEGIEDGSISVNYGGNGKHSIKASDNVVTRDYPVELFNSVCCNVPCDIEFTEGEPSLSITTSDNIHDIIVVTSKDGRLEISSDGGISSFKNLQKFKALISAPQLNGLTINGAGDFEADHGIVTDGLEIEISGAGDVEINGLKCSGDVSVAVNGAGNIEIDRADCQSIKVEINGAGNCELEGHAGSADLEINGVGNIDIAEFSADNLKTNVGGIGRVRRK